MKKTDFLCTCFTVALVAVMTFSVLFLLSGCDKKDEKDESGDGIVPNSESMRITELTMTFIESPSDSAFTLFFRYSVLRIRFDAIK